MSEHIASEIAVVAGYKGILCIGDPCLGTRRRVGRVDDTWASSFAKLEEALSIAKERNLLPLIAGDLLHESRDIGQLLPIINLLKQNKAILIPRKSRWQERGEGHIAAILSAANISQVAGYTSERLQLSIEQNNSFKTMELEFHSSWGGVRQLDVGAPAYVKIKSMQLTIAQTSSLPNIGSDDEGGALICAGRLIRLSQAEEAMDVAVTAVTLEGIERISLSVMPIVFGDSAGTLEETQSILTRDSQFVNKLREAAVDSLEDEGKGSLVTLCDEVCNSLKRDDWIRSKMLSLVKLTGES